MHIQIQENDFEVGELYQQLADSSGRVGAIVTFTGLVRDFSEDSQVDTLFLEHYPTMTEKALTQIAEQAQAAFALIDLSIVHRVGELAQNDQIVFVGAASEHRQQAFLACQYMMDHLKTDAPFWKKEISQGEGRWLGTKASDEKAKQRWTSMTY